MADNISLSTCIKIGYIFIIIQNINFVYANKNVDDMMLQDLVRLSHPEEYGRHDMHYETVWSTELDSLFKTLALINVSKLHISIKPIHWATIDITNMFKLCCLTELWIVQSRSSNLMQMGIVFQGKVMQKLIYLQKLHLKFRYNSILTLPSFLSSLPNLEVLELSGLRYSGSLYGIMSSLRNKPLVVLKLNQFELMQAKVLHLTYDVKPMILFEPLNKTSLSCLEMCGNYFISFDIGLFNALPQLRILNISQNLLFGDVNRNSLFLDLLLNPVLEVINLSDQYTEVPSVIQKRFADTPNHDTDWSKGQMQRCNNYIFPALSNTASFCELLQCFYSVNITCAMLPNNMNIASLFDVNCDPYIRILIGSKIKEIIMDSINVGVHQSHGVVKRNYTVCFAKNSLEKISVAQNKDYMYSKHMSENLQRFRVTGIDTLSHIDLSYNNLNMSLPPTLETKNLTHFQLQGNLISFENPSDNCLCCMYPKLSYLDISQSKITIIPSGFFKNCDASSFHLNLQNNNIDEWTLSSDLNNMLKSSHVNFSFNQIHFFSEETRAIFKKGNYGVVHLDFRGNPFTCDCSKESIETVKMIQGEFKNGITFVHNKSYQCHHADDLSGYQFLQQIDLIHFTQECKSSLTTKILISVTTLSLVFAVCCVICLTWRYRFPLMTKYYRIKHRLTSQRPRKNSYIYDAFVAYCAEDRYWVHDILMQMLEGRYDFNLCIHYRDFRLGESIDDEIVRNMSCSRAHIVVLSENSVKKMWPKFELERAYTEAIEKQKDLIIIKYGDINKSDVPGLVAQILDSRVYLQWPEVSKYTSSNILKIKQELFWAKLASRLYGGTYPCYLRDVHCCCRRTVRGANINDIIDDTIELSDDEFNNDSSDIQPFGI